MDIYHIWTTYNKKWSKYEILAFSVILLLTVIIMVYCLWKKKLNIIQAAAMIKTSQLVFMRGLFEWDDMIHNGLGCMVGRLMVDGAWRNVSKKEWVIRYNEWWESVKVWYNIKRSSQYNKSKCKVWNFSCETGSGICFWIW